MNPDKQRIAIAEACGWRLAAAGDRDNKYGKDEWQKDGVRTPEGWRGHYFQELPDYPADLNAMHEAENDLSPVLRSIYCDFLMYGRANPDPRPEVFGRWQTVNATAAQRAESFLRTIGAWVDEPKAKQQWEQP